MFKYHTKLVGRNSRKHKRFFFVSILSLAIGIATSLLLWMHINYEKSYDKFFQNSDDLYRISYNINQNGKQLINSTRTPTALSMTLNNETTLVETSSRAFYEDCFMHTENVKLFNQKVVWADSTFLSVFQLDMILGDIESSLSNKYSVVISDKVANIYFGQENPIGKIIKLNEGIEFTVTGIFKELPANTHLSYDFVVSFHTLQDYGMGRHGSWDDSWVCTYMRAKQGTSPDLIEGFLSNMVDKYMADRKEKDQEVKFSLMPVKDIYLHTNLEGEFHPQGNYTKLILLTIIAFFVIVIAWANNINISTALSFERAKQSGIRKLNGANNKTIFNYFIIESFYINLTAILTSMIFLFVALPAFISMVNGAIDIRILFQFDSLVIISSILIVGVVFTGVLPAIIQSSFQAIHVLRNSNGNNNRFNTFRKSLAVFQFTLAIILIGSTMLIYKQLKYMESKDLGIKAQQVLVMRAPSTNNTSGDRRYIEYKSFKKELLQSPYFKSVTASMNIPGQTNRYKNVLVSKNAEQINASFNISFADESYFGTYQVPIIEGRNFRDIIENERNSIIINEKAVEAIGFESAFLAIGQNINVRNNEKKIIGVVKNFHHESLQKELEPYIYEFRHPHEFGYYPALIATTNIKEAIRTAEKVWESHYPDALPDFFFLDEFFNRQYVSYHQLGKLVGTSSILAIVIACLGLFALVSYTVNKKVKEIGVRKVNGARILEILSMLNRDFVRWVAIAFVIATPIAWYAMNKWLENFAYKTTLSWWIFAIAGVLALGIAMLTVSFQSYKAATRNPVEALRYE